MVLSGAAPYPGHGTPAVHDERHLPCAQLPPAIGVIPCVSFEFEFLTFWGVSFEFVL